MKTLVTIKSINRQIINCTLCNRLVPYIQLIGKNKVRRFSNDVYWSKPVTGFGDIQARILIIGLAPGAHGANRTGRLFTGDHSGQWLMKALYETGFSNFPTSTSIDDGLLLKDVYIASCIRCAPPLNKPLNSEIENCSRYLSHELQLLKKVKVIITLGSTSFKTFSKIYDLRKIEFYHLAHYEFNEKHLIISYHPSRHNTSTGRLTWEMWLKVFKLARTILCKNGLKSN
jgi:uracil-DNA glycosylase family 4